MANFKLSVDDGCQSDVRVAELSRKYGIETIFYWPVEWHSLAYDKGYKPLSYIEAKKIASEFEIGAHTITHRHLTSIDSHDAGTEISESQDMLEELFNIKITKFCPPRGYTNKPLTNFTLAIYDSQRLTKGEGLVHIHPNSGANGNVHWIDYYNSIKDTADIELWGHSWEFDKYDMWDDIEDFFKNES